MVGWHHRLDGHELVMDREAWCATVHGACCSPWGHKESDLTEQHLDQLNLPLGNRNETLFLEGRVYSFVKAATTKHHRLSDEQQKSIFSQSWS